MEMHALSSIKALGWYSFGPNLYTITTHHTIWSAPCPGLPSYALTGVGTQLPLPISETPHPRLLPVSSDVNQQKQSLHTEGGIMKLVTARKLEKIILS